MIKIPPLLVAQIFEIIGILLCIKTGDSKFWMLFLIYLFFFFFFLILTCWYLIYLSI